LEARAVICVVVFEKGSELDGIADSAFTESALKSIVIPLSVVVLGKASFALCKSLESVIFESGSRLERIETGAFRESGLKSIEIPSFVVVLGVRSFSRCTSLRYVAFENGSRLERIEGWAFEFSLLKSIVIPSSVVDIGTRSLSHCRSLKSVIFGNGSRLERIDVSAFSCMDLACRASRSRLKSIVIPSSVVVLGAWSFAGHRSLEWVRFEARSQLERIEAHAFSETGLRSIVIPSSVILLGNGSFSRCKSLESVIFENGSRLQRIESSPFSECGLKSIIVPSSVIVLGNGGFSQCEWLASVAFKSDSQLERIEQRAFAQSGLKSMEIPARVTFIDGSAFHGVRLNSISISSDNVTFRIREWFLESSDGSAIYRYFGSHNSIVIPSSVVVFGKDSFSQCQTLESVIVENGSLLERIEQSAFSQSGLKSFVIPPSVTFIDDSAFKGTPLSFSRDFRSSHRF
jgi:hypothetical protein